MVQALIYLCFAMFCFEVFVPQWMELIIILSSRDTIIGPCKERLSCFMSLFIALFYLYTLYLHSLQNRQFSSVYISV